MLCQSCGESNASIHLTKIVNGKVEEKHLCNICATEGINSNFELPFPFHKLFTGLMESIEEDPKETKDILCLECGLTYSEFLETGKFGCSDCFYVFEEDVDSLLKGIHGHSRHIGKVPLRLRGEGIHRKEIESLRAQLEKFIAEEEFEKAALLRDEIKQINEKLDNSEE